MTIRIPPGAGAGAVTRQTSSGSAPAAAAQVAVKPQVAQMQRPKVQGIVAMAPLKLTVPLAKVAEKKTERKSTDYEEDRKRVEEESLKRAQELKKIAEDMGVQPDEITLGLVVSLKGEQDRVCSFCGQPTCNFRPVTYRKANSELDLLNDTIVQFQEGASLAGINYFIVVMDEEVQMIRPPGPPESEAERAETRDAYQAFRDRHELGRPTDRAWLDQELRNWTPAAQNKVQAGEANDEFALELTRKVLDMAGTPIKSMLMVRSDRPRVRLQSQEPQFAAAGINVAAIGVGREAENIRPYLFQQSMAAVVAHELIEKLGEGIALSLKAAES